MSRTNGTSSEASAVVPDNLFLWSWFIVLGIVLVGLVSNLIVIHAICFVKRFHRFVHHFIPKYFVWTVVCSFCACYNRPQNFMLANLSLTSVMTLLVYIIVNLLETYPTVPFSPVACGVVVTVCREFPIRF